MGLQGEFGASAGAGRYHVVFAFFVSLMFGISLGSLFGYHCYLLVNNRSTLGELRMERLICNSVAASSSKMVYGTWGCGRVVTLNSCEF